MTYDYEYEEEMMAVLRCLKYLQIYHSERFRAQLKFFGKETLEEILQDFYFLQWEIFDDYQNDFDEGMEMDCIVAFDPVIDRYCELNAQLYPKNNQNPWEAIRRKLQDTVEYYVISCTNSIADYGVPIEAGRLCLKFWLSPDIDEPFALSNGLINLMLALRAENERMEKRVSGGKQTATPALVSQNTTEEAA